jgi:hypothetical protein
MADSATPELAKLYQGYRSGRLTRRDILDGIANLAGGTVAAALLLPILESHDAAAAPETVAALSLRELSDRIEIRVNVWDFATALDLQAWHLLDSVFATDAELLYGGTSLKGPAIRQGLRDLLARPELRGYSHMMLEPRIAITGDSAESLTRCLNAVEATFADQHRQARYHFLCYHFQHVRTPAGWRIRRSVAGAGEPDELHWQSPVFTEAESRPPSYAQGGR